MLQNARPAVMAVPLGATMMLATCSGDAMPKKSVTVCRRRDPLVRSVGLRDISRVDVGATLYLRLHGD